MALIQERLGTQRDSQARVEARLDTIQALLNAASNDPDASVLGRRLLEEVRDVKTVADNAVSAASRLERRFWIASGAIGVIVWIAAIIGPVIAKSLLGVPS